MVECLCHDSMVTIALVLDKLLSVRLQRVMAVLSLALFFAEVDRSH